MSNDEHQTHPSEPAEPSELLTRLAAEIELNEASEFSSSNIGRLLTRGSAFAALAVRHLPPDLASDARWLQAEIGVLLQGTLAACVLSVDDVMGGRDWGVSNFDPPTDAQLEAMRFTRATRHFSDTICDGDFWYIVDAIREEVGLSTDED